MISLYMPAYQVESLVGQTVKRIPTSFWEQIHTLHIINDGSSDSTWNCLLSLAQENPKIHAVQVARNQGYGATVRQGIALCIQDSCEIIGCLHADGQYAPELLPTMMAYLEEHDLDLLQGSRLARKGAIAGGMPRYKWVFGKLLVAMENVVFRLSLSDYHSGYLLFSRRFLEASGFVQLHGRFEIDLELIATASANGFRIGEYPIPTRYAGEESHLNPVGYGLRVLAVLFRYLRGKYAR